MLSGLSVRFKKSIWLRTAAIFLALLLGLAGGIYVYAKYYSISAKEGIAIATGVYFTANYAAASTTEMDENGNQVQVEAFVESVVDSSYKGGDASFTFEIRNYENNLLFNTSNVDIPYTVEFWLGEEITDGAAYSVKVLETGASHILIAGEANRITIANQSIDGGAANANKYEISVDAPGDSGHVAIPVYVRAQTLSGSLINRTLTGKMILSSTDRTTSYIETNEFVVPEEVDRNDKAAKFEALEKQAAFTYEIRTAGAVTSGELTENLVVSWNPNVLQIDLFDEAYLNWLDKNPTGLKADAEGWYSIEIEAMPYASENIGFFRGIEFATKATDWDILHSNIKVKKVTTSS